MSESKQFAGVQMKANQRNKKGTGQIAEFIPALVVIFIVILFPMLDLLYLGLAYACGWYCNHLVVREVACRIPNTATGPGTAAGDATAAWTNTGLAHFIGANAGAVTNAVSFTPGAAGQGPISCTVTTIVTVQPFLPIPMFMQIEGLNKPVKFTFSAERPHEEKGIQ
jgi:hypothetical protein